MITTVINRPSVPGQRDIAEARGVSVVKYSASA
jgi:hypothetical protein